MRYFALLASGLIMTAATAPALAQDSLGHASIALKDASGAVGHLTASGVQTVGGLSAVPFAVVGGVSTVGGASAQAGGSVLSESGEDLTTAAGDLLAQTWGPLPVDDRVVVAPDPAPNSRETGK